LELFRVLSFQIPETLFALFFAGYATAKQQGLTRQGVVAALILTAFISVMMHEYYEWALSGFWIFAPVLFVVCFSLFLVCASVSAAFRARMWGVIVLVSIGVTLGYSAPHLGYIKDLVTGSLK
jgi:hypothetical protein